jgi:hypothetical protein
MSQRLIQPGRTAATRIGTTEAGTVVWSLAGGDGTGDEGANDDGKSGEDDDDSDEGDDDEGDDKDDEGDDDEDKPVYTQAEYDKIRRRMRAADKRAAEFEADNRRLKSGKVKPPVAKKTAKPVADADDDDDADERDEKTRAAEARAEKAEKRARAAAIETAMVRAMSKAAIDWADPDDVSKFMDLDDIDVDEDGTVDSKQLVRALKVLAKAKPHLVKPKTQSGSDDDKDGADGAQGGASAPKMNGNRKGTKTVDKTTLKRRFPALRA